MLPITKAVPKLYNLGTDDKSRRALVPGPELIPQHLPHVYGLAERGPSTPQLVIGDAFTQLFGDRTLDVNAPYYNHASEMASVFMQNANQIMYQRIIPEDAEAAMIRLSVELVRTKVPVYDRDANGFHVRDVNGDLVPTLDNDDDPVTVEGYNVIWHINPAAQSAQAFGEAAVVNNFRSAATVSGLSTYNGTPTALSRLYPIADIPVQFAGDFGNRFGIRLSAPHGATLSPGNIELMKLRKAYIYRLGIVEKDFATSTPILVENNDGEVTGDYAFRRDMVDPNTNLGFSIEEKFVKAYEDTATAGLVPKYSPFGDMHLYYANLEAALEILRNGELEATVGTLSEIVGVDSLGEKDYDATAETFGRDADLAFSNVANLHLLNIFTGVDINGVPYETFTVANSVALGGSAFGSSLTHYCVGGDDGLFTETDVQGVDYDEANYKLANLKIFDQAVGVQLANYGDGSMEAKMLNDAKYPVSAYWDSGFSMDTKRKMFTVIGKRKDVQVICTPYSIAEYANISDLTSVFGPQADLTISQENARAILLRTAALLYPESEIFGTPTCRVTIIGHKGTRRNSLYRGKLPLIFDFAAKVARYMGAGNGRWVEEYNFGRSPVNQVTEMYDINDTWKSDSNYIKDWDAGLNWVADYNRSTYFYPAVQTVYPDDTSVLNSFFTVSAICYVNRVANSVWRDLTGRDDLSDEQLIERSNELINERLKDRHNGRYVFVPETYFTAADAARGYSWSSRVKMYANNMKTVNVFNVEAHRMEDLEA